MIKGFRDFVVRGNVIDLAVAVVMGAAFTALVNSFVNAVINPLLGAFGSKNLNTYVWCLKGVCDKSVTPETGVYIAWGSIVSALITFLITATIVYFVIVVPYNRMRAFMDRNKPAPDAPITEIDLLTEIRDELRSGRDGGAPVGAGAPTS